MRRHDATAAPNEPQAMSRALELDSEEMRLFFNVLADPIFACTARLDARSTRVVSELVQESKRLDFSRVELAVCICGVHALEVPLPLCRNLPAFRI